MTAVLWLLPAVLCGQWLNFKTPGIPSSAEAQAVPYAVLHRLVYTEGEIAGIAPAANGL
jgi:hypothetical protein